MPMFVYKKSINFFIVYDVLFRLKFMWYVYLIRCADDSLYTGIAKDVTARIIQHNLGKGAKYTRARLPVALVYSETCADKSAALRREYAIKQLSRTKKLTLIQSSHVS